MAKYIEYDVALQFVYDACTECMESCEEFDGIYPDCHQCPLEGVKLKLRHTPAADVRPVVKARWIHMPSDGKFRDTCVCSACKKSPPIESWIVQGFNACPYCFADMREEN